MSGSIELNNLDCAFKGSKVNTNNNKNRRTSNSSTYYNLNEKIKKNTNGKWPLEINQRTSNNPEVSGQSVIASALTTQSLKRNEENATTKTQLNNKHPTKGTSKFGFTLLYLLEKKLKRNRLALPVYPF